MLPDDYTINCFDFCDPQPVSECEALLDRAFGLDRRAKASYRLREGEQPADGLSFELRDKGGRLCAVVSFWHLRIGQQGCQALLLGPLAVEPKLQGRGLGRHIMGHGLTKASELGHRLVLLVGDLPYYSPFGFNQVPPGRLLLPGTVDPKRLLYKELTPAAFAGVAGLVLSPSRFAEQAKGRPAMSTAFAEPGE
jgi:predicted N-acetyltransferase YhbS